ncbi:copper homeostasis protein CutC [Paraclostridium sordellii]|uniref:PF03932 family protein CutC n=1 Tax=Paraclostridium sordellii TaxID=1505 RepID=A0A0C7QHR4_PARSO|nr:copper homeostasis protein CutC [Paeniclostridium sordellii]CEN22332.1 copper homeostasis protein [[Clostridium] sordellii] [Paeniclostridium sordellii]CEN78999.1 copper homeostasis protein [[Clostridium] sordellii] [Paeniclostridium sordellii]CEP39922.1 copper homeostasis protein [[Clostridium] sordellii] [Paeniclostridium sordellii]CEP96155.1 copper homeostasis protein [[Clostridium] sordellii] [Paeniclostridium sordellii]CEQ00375.1 copper homeostasis protein [[Clostridium] sordellii] [Pa
MLEIIGMSVEDAIAIEKCGADRIELVSALTEGGLTPSFGLIESVVNKVKIPVNVMIRHHAKSFVYSDEDINIMIKDIEKVKEIGANGVVFGVLDEKNNIREEQLITLLEAAKGLDVTYHRAIDETNVIDSIKILTKYEYITNVLTSAGKGNIENNIEKIKEMKKNAGSINILLGGGLNFENIDRIKNLTNNKDFHFGTAIRVDKNPFGEIDEVKLRKLVEIINN